MKIVLGLSIDTLDTLDDELLAEISGIRFIAQQAFKRHFGTSFNISVQDGNLTLSAASAS